MYKLLIISTKYNSISGCAPVEELQMQIDYLQKFNLNIQLLLDPTQYELEKILLKNDFSSAYTTTMFSYHKETNYILPYDYNIIQILEYYKVNVIGSDMFSQLFVNDKYLCGHKSGIAPQSWLITRNNPFVDSGMNIPFPVILKPNNLSGSCGVDQNSIVHNMSEFYKHIDFLFARFPQINEIIAEKFITKATEYTISVLGNGNNKVFSITKLIYPDTENHVYSECEKNLPIEKRSLTYSLEENQNICMQLKYHANRLFDFFHLHDFARFDILFDNRCYLIDCNALPVQGNSFSWEWQKTYGLKKSQILALLLCEFHYRKVASGKPDNLPEVLIKELPVSLTSVLSGQLPTDGVPESTIPSSHCPKVALYTMVDRISAESEILVLLRALVISLKPQLILETGTYRGSTASAMLQGIEYNQYGEIITLEADRELAKNAQREIDSSHIKIIHINSLDYIPEKPIDLLYLDSSRPTRIKEFWHFKEYLSSNAIIIWHDSAPEHACVYKDINDLYNKGIIDRILFNTPRGITISKLRS